MQKKDMGTAAISPGGDFAAGTTGTWTITHTVGKYGIDDGGSIIIVRRAMSDAVMPQCDYPERDGYVSASTDGEASIRIIYDNRYWIRPLRGAIVVKVFDGSLCAGDTVTVTIGDTSCGSSGWSIQTFPETYHRFMVLVDAFGTREYYEIEDHPYFRIVPGSAARIDAVLPSTAAVGVPVAMKLRIMDIWDNPLDTYSGIVTIHCPDGVECSIPHIALTAGVQDAGTVVFGKAGIYRLSATTGDKKCVSNPIVVSECPDALFWADMHGQTVQTVGTGSVEEYFNFARNKGLMDVTAWQGNDFQVTDETWDEVCRVTKAFNDPGRFVTFPGYEWSGLTPSGGDHNILYLKDDQPIHRSSHWQVHDGSSETSDRYPISALFDGFRGRNDVMAIAHVGGRYANFDFWDDDFSGLVEIHSHHGTFEWFAEDALDRGLVIGLVGQSDDHTGRPGLSAPLRPLARDFATFDVYGGYTGIYADDLSRESVWKALRDRHCYATTGKRIYLDVRTPGGMMGDVMDGKTSAELDIEIAGTAPLLDVEVKRGTKTVYRYPFELDPDDMWIRIEWSGVRVKSRAKTADWDGSIEIEGGDIVDFRTYAFDQECQGIDRIDERSLKVVSTTSGDIDGVFLKVTGDKAHIICENAAGKCSVDISELDAAPLEKNFGAVNLAMRFSLASPFSRPDSLKFDFTGDVVSGKLIPYWVKTVQLDGHMTWSSPIYFR